MTGCENHLENNSIEKSSKHRSEKAAFEHKTASEKAFFCSYTVFSLYFKKRMKQFYASQPLAVALTSCFGVTKIIASI